MKQHKIHIVRSEDETLNLKMKREVENYKWREINGICLNEPLDKFNHAWDAAGYGYIELTENKRPQIIW